MRTLTQIRCAQLNNGWTVTADGESVEYAPRENGDQSPFLNPRSGVRYTARSLTAAPYTLADDEPLAVGLIMDWNEHSYHVLVRKQYRIADELTACGRTAVSGTGHVPVGRVELERDLCRKCGRNGLRELALATANRSIYTVSGHLRPPLD